MVGYTMLGACIPTSLLSYTHHSSSSSSSSITTTAPPPLPPSPSFPTPSSKLPTLVPPFARLSPSPSPSLPPRPSPPPPLAPCSPQTQLKHGSCPNPAPKPAPSLFLASSASLGIALGLLAIPDVAQAAASALHSHAPLESDMRALALGPNGPLVEEFWENMRRYGLYFLTVATGGIYSLLEPVIDLLKNPLTAILTAVIISGSFYLLYLTLSTMLGLSNFDYNYS